MKKHSLVILVVALVIAAGSVSAQTRDTRLRTKGYINPQEIVSLDSTMRMDQAFGVLNELSKQYAGKIIIDLQKSRRPIGVYIVNQHWRDALELICARNGLTYTEEQDYIRVVPMTEASAQEARGAGGPPLEPPPTLESQDIKISAVFFNTNLSKLQNYGISWNFFRSKQKEPQMTFYNSAGIGRGDTTSPVPPRSNAATGGGANTGPSLNTAIGVLESPPSFTFANIDALVKFFGSNNLGEVVTSPEVIVRNNRKGRIQVGQDIFITTKDIAGNTVNQLYSTGTIIEVTPTIYTQSDTDFIYLDLSIEQSDVAAGPSINRTAVKTHALLYNGEETIIGGLFTTTDQQTREGIPVLKDLPWWFFGLRYVFGSDTKVKTKNELIVLMKAELLPAIRDRYIHRASASEKNLIDEKRKEHQKEYENK